MVNLVLIIYRTLLKHLTESFMSEEFSSLIKGSVFFFVHKNKMLDNIYILNTNGTLFLNTEIKNFHYHPKEDVL